MTDVDKADVKEYEYRRRIIELEMEYIYGPVQQTLFYCRREKCFKK